MADTVKVLTRVKVSATVGVKGIAPKGVIEITENGTYSVFNYSSALVNVTENDAWYATLLTTPHGTGV
jgi:hypothetical protein